MTITLGDISVRYVNLLLDTAENLGLATTETERQFGLTSQLLRQPNARISIPKFMRLGHTLIHLGQCPTLGLQMAEQAHLSLMGMAGFCAASANSVLQGLSDIVTYESLSSKNVRGQSSFYQEKNVSVAEFYSISPYNDFNYFIVDMALAIEHKLVQQLSAQPLRPMVVQIEFPPPAYANHYESFFQCPVKFNQPRNALVYKTQDLLSKPILHNPVAYLEIREVCDAQLATARQQLSLQERVMHEITPLLQSNNLSLEEVANRLDIPVWTLRRKLKQENTGFTALLDQTRQALASIYLKDRQYTLGEVAYLLGFSNPNAFQRAFKRWYGVTPGQFRQHVHETSD